MHLLIRESLSFYPLTLNKLQQVWPNALLHYDKDVQRHLVLQRDKFHSNLYKQSSPSYQKSRKRVLRLISICCSSCRVQTNVNSL